jgi:hypothetical protein
LENNIEVVADCGLLPVKSLRSLSELQTLIFNTLPAITYTKCCVAFVCPAVNQGTFKYNNLSVNQEVSSLKLIHHNFK